MTYTYVQRTGGFYRADGELVVVGYSGAGLGKNNPALQSLRNVGPIPVGTYTIGAPYNSSSHGPLCMALIPAATNVMWGRSAFLIHGDSIRSPGTASQGCIILPGVVRKQLTQTPNSQLRVVAELAEV